MWIIWNRSLGAAFSHCPLLRHRPRAAAPGARAFLAAVLSVLQDWQTRLTDVD